MTQRQNFAEVVGANYWVLRNLELVTEWVLESGGSLAQWLHALRSKDEWPCEERSWRERKEPVWIGRENQIGISSMDELEPLVI
jgi:hypothetical protein